MWIWRRGALENQHCGCGQPFKSCPFWSEVFERAFGDSGEVHAEGIAELIDSRLRTRHLLGASLLQRRLLADAETAVLGEALSKLYQAIQYVSQASIIVDTSKSPVYGRLLQELEGLDVQALQLVRDPRAVSYSWQRIRRNPMTGALGLQIGLVKSSLIWLAWNLAAMWLRAKRPGDLRLRYEDFIERPRAHFQTVANFIKVAFDGAPFVGASAFKAKQNHILSGNFRRFEHGLISLTPDMEWKERMHPLDKALVTLVTFPGLPLFGYPLIT